MDAINQLILKRPVNLKVIVTSRWKEEVQQQLQAQINQTDAQMQQLDMQGQRAIAEIQKQSIKPPGPEVTQQIDNIQSQVNQKKKRNATAKKSITHSTAAGAVPGIRTRSNAGSNGKLL